MKKLIVFASLIFACVTGYSQTKNFIDQPYVAVTAKADTLVIADKIYLKILLNEKDTRGKVSLEELEEKMGKELTKLGINISKDLSIVDLSSNFKKYFLRQQNVLKNKAFSLLVFNGVMATKVIIALEKLNISNVSLEKLEHSEIENVRLLVKTKAVLKAKKQADCLTIPLGQKTGKAIHISDTQNNYRSFQSSNLDEMVVVGYGTKRKNEFKPLDVEFQKIKVSAQLEVKFAID
ncbi:SIMPL domain-containing protein [Bacteroidota bacterium]